MSSTEEIDLLRAIDRLVDGELSRGDEARLLARLDAAPEGWKQLALAFVESREWRVTLSQRAPAGDVGAAAAPSTDPRAAIARTDPDRADATPARRRSHGLFAAALAASLLAGALGGLGIARWRADGRAADVAAGAAAPLTTKGGGLQEPDSKISARPVGSARPAAAVENRMRDGNQLVDSAPREGALTMFVGGGTSDGAKQIDLPVIPVSQADPSWLDADKASVPEPFRQVLEKDGRVVHVRRRFYPVLLNDGRRVVVPIDDVEVR